MKPGNLVATEGFDNLSSGTPVIDKRVAMQCARAGGQEKGGTGEREARARLAKRGKGAEKSDEKNLSGIGGIRQINSTSRNEASSIKIAFNAGIDVNDAAADVRDKVSSVRDQLPDDVEEPVIEKANADDQPMMWIPLRSSELEPPEPADRPIG